MANKKRNKLLEAAYRGSQKVLLETLKAVRGPKMDGPTSNLIDRVEEDRLAGRDCLEGLREVHRKLSVELFEKPKRFDSSYRLSDDQRKEIEESEREIASLEAKERRHGKETE